MLLVTPAFKGMEIGEIPAVQGKVGNLLGVDHLADLGTLRLQQLRIRIGHGDGLIDVAHFEDQIHTHGLSDQLGSDQLSTNCLNPACVAETEYRPGARNRNS